MTKTARMARHVELLVQTHGLTSATHSRGGSASPRARHVRFRPVKSEVTYAVALHEIGHVVGRGRSAPRLQAEAAAWVWALENALPDAVGERFRVQVQRSLGSYLRWAVARGARPGHSPAGAPKLPAPDSVFWPLARFGRLPGEPGISVPQA
jgi:hypothetical protein